MSPDEEDNRQYVPPRGVVERGSEASRIRRAGQGIPSAIPRRHMARCVRGSAVRT